MYKHTFSKLYTFWNRVIICIPGYSQDVGQADMYDHTWLDFLFVITAIFFFLNYHHFWRCFKAIMKHFRGDSAAEGSYRLVLCIFIRDHIDWHCYIGKLGKLSQCCYLLRDTFWKYFALLHAHNKYSFPWNLYSYILIFPFYYRANNFF